MLCCCCWLCCHYPAVNCSTFSILFPSHISVLMLYSNCCTLITELSLSYLTALLYLLCSNSSVILAVLTAMCFVAMLPGLLLLLCILCCLSLYFQCCAVNAVIAVIAVLSVAVLLRCKTHSGELLKPPEKDKIPRSTPREMKNSCLPQRKKKSCLPPEKEKILCLPPKKKSCLPPK